MIEVPGILNGDGCLAHDRRDALERNLDPILVEERRDDGAIRCEDLRSLGQRGRVHRLRKALEVLHHIAGGHPGTADERQRHEPGDQASDDGSHEQGSKADSNAADAEARARRGAHGRLFMH